MPDLCADPLLGLDFQTKLKRAIMEYGGTLPPLVPSVVAHAKINQRVNEPLSKIEVDFIHPFANLPPDCKPTATQSRRYSVDNKHFITGDGQSLFKQGMIEPTKSTWRAHVVA